MEIEIPAVTPFPRLAATLRLTPPPGVEETVRPGVAVTPLPTDAVTCALPMLPVAETFTPLVADD